MKRTKTEWRGEVARGGGRKGEEGGRRKEGRGGEGKGGGHETRAERGQNQSVI